MDKDEAERLARAIGMVHMNWIKVDQVVHNSTTGQYEVQCAYQREDQGQTLSGGSWTTLNIKSPRKSDRFTHATWWWLGTSLSKLSWTLPHKRHRSHPRSHSKEEVLCQLPFFRTVHAVWLTLSDITAPLSALTHTCYSISCCNR